VKVTVCDGVSHTVTCDFHTFCPGNARKWHCQGRLPAAPVKCRAPPAPAGLTQLVRRCGGARPLATVLARRSRRKSCHLHWVVRVKVTRQAGLQGSRIRARLLSSEQLLGVRSRRTRTWRTPGCFPGVCHAQKLQKNAPTKNCKKCTQHTQKMQNNMYT
jgi:hypothetical protein